MKEYINDEVCHPIIGSFDEPGLNEDDYYGDYDFVDFEDTIHYEYDPYDKEFDF